MLKEQHDAYAAAQVFVARGAGTIIKISSAVAIAVEPLIRSM